MPKFGVAKLYEKDLPSYIVKLSQDNVDAYEMGFDKSIPRNIPDDIISASKKYDIVLSCHLPFWINLGSRKESNSTNLASGLRVAESLRSIAVLHLGFYGDRKFNELKNTIINDIEGALNISNVKYAKLGIETTGKQKAIGTCNEILELITLIDDERVVPVIDWSHLYARNSGSYPYSYEDFKKILEEFESRLKYKSFHFHGGCIEYEKGNEVRHLSAKTHEPPLPYLFAALQDLGYEKFTFIVESPDSIEDVKWLKQVWRSPSDYFARIPNKVPKVLFDFVKK